MVRYFQLTATYQVGDGPLLTWSDIYSTKDQEVGAMDVMVNADNWKAFGESDKVKSVECRELKV